MWISFAVAFLVNMLVGGLWYLPCTFLDCVMDAKEKAKCEGMKWTHMVGCNLFALLEITGLYHAVGLMGAKNALDAAKVGYLLWQFMVFPTIGVHYLFNNRPVKEMMAILGHHLVGFMLEAAVFGHFSQ